MRWDRSDGSVRLMAEYGSSFPLWGDERAGGRDAEDWVLPQELHADLCAWQEDFEQNFSHETGWPSAQARDRHRSEGMALLAWLRQARPDRIFVFDYWQTTYLGGRDGEERS